MPAPLQSTQLVATKQDGKRYITVNDKSTQSFVDFACKKLMWLMALIAAVVAVAVVATGGAALIAIGAIAGAAGAVVGAVMGSLICGQKAAMARKWIGEKNNFKILGISTVTGNNKMHCSIFGEDITYAPKIKSWWQAISLGTANFIGGVLQGAMIGAAVGAGGALLRGGMAALGEGGASGLGRSALQLVKSLPGNLVQNVVGSYTTGMGLGIRGVLGVQQAAESYGSTGSAGAGDAAKGFFGMELGTYQSGKNIFTGHGTAMDYLGLGLWFAPIAKGTKEGGGDEKADPDEQEAPKNQGKGEADPTGGGDPEAYEDNTSLEDKINESQDARDRAVNEHQDLGKKYESKTVATDGIKAVSGWKKVPSGFTNVSPEQVKSYSDQIGHEPKKSGAMDQNDNGGFDGKYNSSHAEKKVLTANPNDPVGVSRPMCSDCQNFAQQQAIATGDQVVVSDPNGTHIFNPDGSHDFISK